MLFHADLDLVDILFATIAANAPAPIPLSIFTTVIPLNRFEAWMLAAIPFEPNPYPIEAAHQ